jgi:predicted ATPase
LDADDYFEDEASAAAVAWRADQAAAKLAFAASVAAHDAAVAAALAATPRGLYVWGDVGTGKSMLMDLFFETCELPETKTAAAATGTGAAPALGAAAEATPAATGADLRPRKRRVHFHQFMLELHRRVHATKQRQLAAHGRAPTGRLDLRPERDALRLVAADIAAEAHLLVALKRLFLLVYLLFFSIYIFISLSLSLAFPSSFFCYLSIAPTATSQLCSFYVPPPTLTRLGL